ncbi:ring canal kelch [Brachionus plicatilis]|uniref:Ring canal kelch n=1 Tax=Brachionus plicatilis TaxID=10195 RepID=A0A3M7PEJ8_BRAPC|nr:ring canal kelch [Brachionus plicatilis]
MFDVTLVCDSNIETNCHKEILIVKSPFFMAIFSSSFMEFRNRLYCFISYRRLHVIRRISITENNVQSLLVTSNLLDMASLKLSCGQFIESQLDVTTCLGIREFGDTHSCYVLLNMLKHLLNNISTK